MEKGKICCCCDRKETTEELRRLLQDLGCKIEDKKDNGGQKKESRDPKSHRDPYELNLAGSKKNPCLGTQCAPRPYLNPPDYSIKQPPPFNLDGRDVRACEVQPKPPDIKWSDYGPRNPPWMRPRYASVELRGGVHHLRCSCGKRDGLGDDCRRWDCSGRTECLTKPWPDCCPHTTATDYGVRPPNRLPPPL